MTFNCDVDFVGWEAGWSDQKKVWCCQSIGRGCQSGTSHSNTSRGVIPSVQHSAVNASLGIHETKVDTFPNAYDVHGVPEDGRKVARVSLPGSTTEASDKVGQDQSSDPASHCNTSCRVAGQVSTCKEMVVWASQHRFAGQLGPCSKAHKFVLGLCEVCSACQLEATECHDVGRVKGFPSEEPATSDGRADAEKANIANLAPTSPAMVDGPPRAAVPMATERSSGAAAPLSSVVVDGPPQVAAPHTPAQSRECSRTCSLGGKSATCSNHLLWAAKHVIEDSAEDACGRAHVMVRERCSICGGCTPAAAGCRNQPQPPADPAADELQDSGDTASVAEGCAASCVVDGQSATCAFRVLNVSEHRYGHASGACARAHRIVAEQCLVCAHCSLAAVCGASAKKVGTSPPPLEGSLHAADYDCRQDKEHLDLWTSEKRDWCCRHKHVACVGSFPLQFDCNAGFANWEHAWPAAKQKWCCEHHGRGCQQYSCNLSQNSSQQERAWCCKNRQRGCPHTEIYTRKFDSQAKRSEADRSSSASAGRGASSPQSSKRPLDMLILLATLGSTGFLASVFAARSFLRGDAARLYKGPKVSASNYQELQMQDVVKLESGMEDAECME